MERAAPVSTKHSQELLSFLTKELHRNWSIRFGATRPQINIQTDPLKPETNTPHFRWGLKIDITK